MSTKKSTLIASVVVVTVVVAAALIWLNLQRIAEAQFYYTTGQNGGSADRIISSGRVLGQSHEQAFQKVRSENSYLVDFVNFRTSPGSSDECLAFEPYEDASKRLSIDSSIQDGNVKLELKGYIDSCIQTKQEVAYASVIPANSSLKRNYKHSITEFENLRVKPQLDCMAYEVDGKKQIAVSLRMENGEPSHYQNEFASSCEIKNLPAGEYELKYLSGKINGGSVLI